MFAGYHWSISIHFVAIYPKVCTTTENYKWSIKTLYFRGLISFKVIGVDTIKNLVTSASYNKQHVCAYLQLFSRYTSQ